MKTAQARTISYAGVSEAAVIRSIGSGCASASVRAWNGWKTGRCCPRSPLNTADSGPGSLRQAILDSDAATGTTNTIDFAIPGQGVQTIEPVSPLPAITNPVLIDGSSQPGYDGTPLIELNGSQAGTGDGLTITAPNVDDPRARHRQFRPGRRRPHLRATAPPATGSTAISSAPTRPGRRPSPTILASRSMRGPAET